MKKQTYYCGYFRGRPHISIFNDGFGDVGKSAILFRNKKDAKVCGFEEIRKVKIVEVK